jgi:3-deoxy-manno-octulosonate cytidylyltransferase (CMP-KDO synthetase)
MMQRKVIGLIPARWESSRFQGKPLAEIDGIPMIQRVYEQCLMSKKLYSVIVVTDNVAIHQYCRDNYMEVVMVDDDVETGTDRIALAVKNMHGVRYSDIFINIQGDEPLINPEAIDKMIDTFDHEIGVSVAYRVMTDYSKMNDRNVTKVVINENGHAMFFSRLPVSKLQSLGLFAFNASTLRNFARKDESPDTTESIEMRRFLERGQLVKMVEVEDYGLAVDVPEDIKKVEDFLKFKKEIKEKMLDLQE